MSNCFIVILFFNFIKLGIFLSLTWWYTPLILELRRQRQVDISEFKANLDLHREFQDIQDYIKRPLFKNKTKKMFYILALFFLLEDLVTN